jgi:hypothetical protein
MSAAASCARLDLLDEHAQHHEQRQPQHGEETQQQPQADAHRRSFRR